LNKGPDIPQLFRSHSGDESALYIQNLNDSTPAMVEIQYFDEESGFFCSMIKEVGPNAAGAIWLAGLEPSVCIF
jgi:hypothetical protein